MSPVPIPMSTLYIHLTIGCVCMYRDSRDSRDMSLFGLAGDVPIWQSLGTGRAQ